METTPTEAVRAAIARWDADPALDRDTTVSVGDSLRDAAERLIAPPTDAQVEEALAAYRSPRMVLGSVRDRMRAAIKAARSVS